MGSPVNKVRFQNILRPSSPKKTGTNHHGEPGNGDICWLWSPCRLKLSSIIIVISTNSLLPENCKATRPDQRENLALFCKWILWFEKHAQSCCESHTNISIACVNRGQPLAEITPIFAILVFVGNCAKPVILYMNSPSRDGGSKF